MVENTTTVNTNINNGNGNGNGNGNSNNDIIDIIDIEDDDSEQCTPPVNSSLLRLSLSDVIVVSIDRCELTAAKYHALAEQTANKFKTLFPNNKILVIPSSTSFTVVKQPELV